MSDTGRTSATCCSMCEVCLCQTLAGPRLPAALRDGPPRHAAQARRDVARSTQLPSRRRRLHGRTVCRPAPPEGKLPETADAGGKTAMTAACSSSLYLFF